MNNKNYKTGLVALAFALVAVSCTNNEDQIESRVPISFSESIVQATKGAAAVTTGNMTDFGLYAAYTAQGSYDPGTTGFKHIINAKFVQYQGLWVGESDYYWPGSGSLSFVAYAPYSASLSGFVGLSLPSASSGNGYPVFTYSPPTSGQGLTDMPDLCLATPLINRTKPANGGTEEPLEFHHVLTGVRFKARYNVRYAPGNFSNDFYVKVLAVELGGVIGTKQLSVTDSDPYFVWQADGTLPKNKTYTLTSQDGQVKADALNDVDRQLLNSNSGMLYLLPQTPTNATVAILYGVYAASNDALLASLTSDAITLPTNEWLPGAVMDYLLGPAMNLNDDYIELADGCDSEAPDFYQWVMNGRPTD